MLRKVPEATLSPLMFLAAIRKKLYSGRRGLAVNHQLCISCGACGLPWAFRAASALLMANHDALPGDSPVALQAGNQNVEGRSRSNLPDLLATKRQSSQMKGGDCRGNLDGAMSSRGLYFFQAIRQPIVWHHNPHHSIDRTGH